MRYILFVIDKFAGAKNLIEEITIVYPKSQKPNNYKYFKNKRVWHAI